MSVLDQEGIVKKSGIKKYTANISANFKFLEKKNLGIDINIMPSQTIEDLAPIYNNSGSRGNLIGHALQWNPTKPLILRNAANTADSINFNRNGDLFNPIAVLNTYHDKAKTTTVLASVSPYIKLVKSLEYRLLASINYGTGIRRTSVDPDINYANILNKGQVIISSNELITQQLTHTLSYNDKITSNLNLNAVVGYEYLKFISKGISLNAVGAGNGTGFGN